MSRSEDAVSLLKKWMHEHDVPSDEMYAVYISFRKRADADRCAEEMHQELAVKGPHNFEAGGTEIVVLWAATSENERVGDPAIGG